MRFCADACRRPPQRLFGYTLAVFALCCVEKQIAAGPAELCLVKQQQCRGTAADELTRDALVARTRSGRNLSDLLSDIGLASITAYPWAVDWAILTAGYRQDGGLASTMLLVDGLAVASTFALTSISKRFFRRQRPYARHCVGQPQLRECRQDGRSRSLISGHSSLAFTGAGLVCSHARAVDIYGGTAANLIGCGAALTIAAVTALLRVIADKHYLTDVLAGAAVGLATSLAIPALIGYGKREPTTAAIATDAKLLQFALPF